MTKKTAVRVSGFQKVYGDKLKGFTVKKVGDKNYLEPRDESGKRIGRTFKEGSSTHAILYKLYPTILPIPRGLSFNPSNLPNPRSQLPALINPKKANVTRRLPAVDFKKLGFKNQQLGKKFIQLLKKRGVSVSSLSDLPQIIETYRPLVIRSAIRSNIGRVRKEQLPSAFQLFERSYKIKSKFVNAIVSDVYKYFNRAFLEYQIAIKDFQQQRQPTLKFQITSKIQFFKYAFKKTKSIFINEDGEEEEVEKTADWSPLLALKSDEKNYETKQDYFFSPTIAITSTDKKHIGSKIRRAVTDIINKVDKYTNDQSGYILDRVLESFINISPFQFTSGSSYFPIEFADGIGSKSIINIKNDDNACFLWALMVGLHYNEMETSKKKKIQERYKSYLTPYIKSYGLDFSDMPMTVNIERNLRKYEDATKANIHILQYEVKKSSQPLPMICSKSHYEKSVVLMLCTNPKTGDRHYVTVTNMSGLLGHHISEHGHKVHFCMNCVTASFSCKSALENHQRLCLSNESYLTKFPEGGKAINKFRNYYKQLPVPFVVYADTEALLFRMNKANKTSEHQACGMGYIIVSNLNGESEIVKSFYSRSPNCVREFLNHLKADCKELYLKHLTHIEPMNMTDQDKEDFETEIMCHICGEEVLPAGTIEEYKDKDGNDKIRVHKKSKVRDHCHITGKYRGVAHNSCNLNYQIKKYFPVFYHNLKGYDGHFIIREIEKDECHKIKVLPINRTRYLSFSMILKNNNIDSVQEIEEEAMDTSTCGDDEDIKENQSDKSGFELRFLDSSSFLNESIAKLAKDLRDNDKNVEAQNFKFTRSYINDFCKSQGIPEERETGVSERRSRREELFELLMRKGVYPYEYMTSWDKFNETKLPETEKFMSTLEKQLGSFDELTDKQKAGLRAEVLHAKHVWSSFQCKNLGDYHDVYLSGDIHQLADIFENFRKVSFENYGLDPCHYYSLPALVWDAKDKMTGMKMKLYTEDKQDMYLFNEAGKIGGISGTGASRYARANNKFMDGVVLKDDDGNVEEVLKYDPSKPYNYIMYMDMNGLYSWAMTQPLPYGGFSWVNIDGVNDSDKNLQTFLDNLTGNVFWESGYFLEVDAEIPEELHDYFNDYPPFPENIEVTEDMLSEKQKATRHHTLQQMNRSPDITYRSGKKLIPNLLPKKNYVIHFRLLKLFREMGCKVTKVHRVQHFKQSAWLKVFIDHCMAKRKVAKSDFEKNFWKLSCNAVYGRFLMNKRKHKNIVLSDKQKTLQKLVNKMPEDGNLPIEINGKGLYMVDMPKKQVTLDQPIYAGVAILHLSKWLMYDWYYNVLKRKYGEKVKMLYTDTDSFIFQVFTEDIYRDMRHTPEILNTCDLSNYKKDHPMFEGLDDETIKELIERNKKVVGMIKDETEGMAIVAYVGLRAKMYCLKVIDNSLKSTAKGVKKAVVKRTKFQVYMETLFDERVQSEEMYYIRSNINHELFGEKSRKWCFSAFDDKKHVLDDGINQLSYGHWRIKN